MSEEELAEIEERWRLTAPWPWRWAHHFTSIYSPYSLADRNGQGRVYALERGGRAYLNVAESDARALERAPADIAALLAETRRLREELARARTQSGLSPDTIPYGRMDL